MPTAAKVIALAVVALAAMAAAVVIAIRVSESGVLDEGSPAVAVEGSQAGTIRVGAISLEKRSGDDSIYSLPVMLTSTGATAIDGTCFQEGVKVFGSFAMPFIKVGETSQARISCPSKASKIVITVE